MTSNLVTVQGDFGQYFQANSYGGPLTAQGTYLFAATGGLMDSTEIAIVTPVINGILDGNGNLSVSLLASDNFPAGELLWNCFLRIQGFPMIHVTDFAVNYATGATQSLLSILSAAGWTPPSLG